MMTSISKHLQSALRHCLPAMALIAISLFTGCDNIDPDDRYTPVAKPDVTPEGVTKTLLIQEFTGHNCRNCPTGAAAINSIMDAYPGRVIAVGMHPAGGGVNTEPLGTQDFRCDEAQAMFTFYQPAGFPCVVMNGTEMSTATTTWLTMAMGLIDEPAVMTIDTDVEYDASSRRVSVDYTVNFTEAVSEPLSIMVWVMENGIVGIQNDKGTYLTDYVHNHVLRSSLNGDWGESLGNLFSAGGTITGTASMVLDAGWVAENCQLVVWVFNSSSRAVMQATEADVTTTL